MSETKKHSILIVDDEHANILALIHILNSEYTVYAEKCGRDAIEAAEELLPDVILLDILMPEMDGYEVLSTLKASEKTKNIPVIFITGLREVADERKGLASGAADYITKPFYSEIVQLRVRNQIKIIEQLRTIEQLSMTDPLTGLPNRRSFDARFNAEWGKVFRDQAPVSILMVDIDKFKTYNDTHGHQQGDVALQSFAKTFVQALKRPGDFAARLGGEEFIVLLPNTHAQGALVVAEQIRKCVEAMEIPCPDGLAAKITVSIGANTHEYGDTETVKAFFSGVDEALYAAKGNGRNRVRHFKVP